MKANVIELTTTMESAEQAQSLASLLIEQGLAACVQIEGPLTSIYRWQGEVCQGIEYRCKAKSLESHVDRVVRFIQSNHPYQTPEILYHTVNASEGYAQWLAEQLCT